ncbi:NAD(P)H-hydrate dehydratase [Aquibacillus halophilus]|uniref:Bifunctional NAD(P)H-hydrate repair enzyme n=1 Tax=Aquibacillus halophilus TaxID=930132 RepID=A0A6A8DD70_9BACI|nr:NAD(P)H-hydrate dehydratase [Aquibacillus halophilus]
MHIVTANEMYEIDRFAIENAGVDGTILMENAGRAIAEKVVSLVKKSEEILVLVGSGNNGGDGFVIAKTLLNQGYKPTVLQLAANEKIKGAALYHKQLFINYGGTIQQLQASDEITVFLNNTDVVIDAMLGIGITGTLRPPFDQVIKAVNEVDKLTISVDIPSGVPADEGVLDFIGIEADYTFVIEEPKMSVFLEHCTAYYGNWSVVKIGLPHQAYANQIKRNTWVEQKVRTTLPSRDAFSHKGSHGRGLIIGGSRQMPGSVAMTALASLRAGSGLITIATVKEAISSIAQQCLEATFLPLASQEGVISERQQIDISTYDAIAIGMGMGRKKDTGLLTRKIVAKAKVPVLIDADGLYHISEELSVITNRKSPTILTPHFGEMAMLLDTTIQNVIAHPFSLAESFSRKHGVYLVLKGPNTIVSDPEGNQWVNTTGNAGLAKGGSGDVLSGILLAMIMQRQKMTEALSNGCFIHGKAADNLVVKKHSEQDLLATDVIKGLASVFRTFS